MIKKLLVLFCAAGIAVTTWASVSIATSARTFDKAGGAASIVVTANEAWTAVSDADWLTVASGASGSTSGSVVYIVNANATADTRIGHIKVNANTFTVTQTGYAATISPLQTTIAKIGGSGSIAVSVDAGVSWSAMPNVSWITVSPKSGTSSGTVNYTVAAYSGVVSRVGAITIGGQTFTVTQSGVDVALSPSEVNKDSGAAVVSVSITALATTKWTITPKSSWISVVDKATGYGDYVATLAINANPSFARRTGTVTIGSATLTIVQEGLPTATLSINPETATAAATGAYGNIAVTATPDAAWTAESDSSWITISEGASGSGNGNIKYVATANPTLEMRTGHVTVTPPYKVIEPDFSRGLAFWIKEQENIEGNDHRWLDFPLSRQFDGSFINVARGRDVLTTDSSFSFAFSFKVGELNCINRLMRLNCRCLYLDSAENRLHVALTYLGNEAEAFLDYASDFVVDVPNQWYTIVLRLDRGRLSVWAANKNGRLQQVGEIGDTKEGILGPCGPMDGFQLGWCPYPGEGKLQSGQFGNLRFWQRALTDLECEIVDTEEEIVFPDDCTPKGIPDGARWTYYPLCGNAVGFSNDTRVGSPFHAGLSTWDFASDRFGTVNGCVIGDGSGRVQLNDLWSNFQEQERDATYSAWVWIGDFPKDDEVEVIARRSYRLSDMANRSYGEFCMVLASNGNLRLRGENLQTIEFSSGLSLRCWHMISLVGKAERSIQVYLDGVEIGNVSYPYALGYYRYSTSYTTRLTLGGWNGALDDFLVISGALTSAQVRELYNKQKVQKVVHTVTQGVQSASVSPTAKTAPAEGCTGTASLTLAQSVQWTAKSNVSWIRITSDVAGAGSAVIAYTVEANPAVTSRKGTLTIAGKTVTVTQQGLRASVECDDTSFGVESDMGVIIVDTEGGGTWTASTDASWIHLIDTAGTGTGTAMFVVDDYTTTTESRSGTITIAGKKVIVTQQGYELSIDPAIAEIGSNAGAGQFGVAAPIDAVWEALADCDWITIIGSRTGIGDGVIQYKVADNTTGETRVGRISISGKVYTITQKTTLPVTTKVVGSGTIKGAGNYNQGTQVQLTATPASGYVFSHWSGDAVGNEDKVSITVDTDKSVTATFIPEEAAQKLVELKAAQGGFYTRDQIHNLELGKLVLDVDAATGKARIGVQLQETSDLANPDWKAVNVTTGDLDVGADGTVGIKASATGNAKFFRVVTPEK